MSTTDAPASTRTVAARPTRSRRPVRGALRWLSAAILGATLITGVVALAPTAVGGPASYVVTQGTSMLPTYDPGGVIVTRERGSYAVGDVVGYRNPELGEMVVLHRIVEVDGDRFVMQGDNNDFLDAYRPAVEDVVGEAWFYVPRAGDVLASLRQPVVFGIVVALMTLLAFRSSPATGDRRRRDDES